MDKPLFDFTKHEDNSLKLTILEWIVSRRFKLTKVQDKCHYLMGYNDALNELSDLLETQGWTYDD